METVGSTNVKSRLNRYLEQVRRGARFIVTDHGKPVAKLVPSADREEKSAPEIIAELLAKGIFSCRNADLIHLACALQLVREGLNVLFVSFDKRFENAARDNRLTVLEWSRR